MDERRISLPAFFPWQKEVHDSDKRFKVVCIGRQAGKTHFAAVEIFARAIFGGKCLWVSPTHMQSELGMRVVLDLLEQSKDAIPYSLNRSNREITIKSTGGTIKFHTADDPDKLRGPTLDFIVLDEAAFINPDIWSVLRPTLIRRKGSALFISTPCGKNWFYEIWKKGQSESQVEWASWQLPSSVNPLLSEDDFEAARNDALVNFDAEYLAQFTEAGYSVFTNFQACIDPDLEPTKSREDGHQYVIGVDWGRFHDWTVYTCIDKKEKKLCQIEKYQGMPFEDQIHRLVRMQDRFKAEKIIAEGNSFGDANIEALQKRVPCHVERFWTSHQSKTRIIDGLNLAFNSGDITLYPDKTLIEELERFTASRNKSGVSFFGAPLGHHDDHVMSLAITWHGVLDEALPDIETFDRTLIGI